MYSRGRSWFVSFCLNLVLFAKIKRPGFYTLTETSLSITSLPITQDLKKIKDPENPFVDNVK